MTILDIRDRLKRVVKGLLHTPTKPGARVALNLIADDKQSYLMLDKGEREMADHFKGVVKGGYGWSTGFSDMARRASAAGIDISPHEWERLSRWVV